MQQIVLLVFAVYMLWLLVRDARHRTGVSRVVWIVVVWAAMIGSRPVSTWFSYIGGAGGQAAAYDEGSPIERVVYFVLIALGLYTLHRRHVSLRAVIQANQCLTVFFLYWLCSVVWSDAPLVSFKRWVKDVGNVAMVLVLLTEEDPLEAIRAVFARCAYVLIPMSVLLIKYYGELGRTYHVWTGEMMYTGVCTHKNTLGVMVLVCGLFFMWDFLGRFRNRRRSRDWIGLAGELSLMVMSVWLLHMAHSSTSLACAVAGAAIFFGLGVPSIRRKAKHLEVYVIVGGFALWMLNSVLDVSRFVVVDLLGRDLTLTTRTEVWPMLLEQSDGFLLGAGFNSFWSGERLVFIYNKLGIIQAHNGYLETYLNGGLLGVVLLVVFLLAANRAARRQLVAGSDYARVRMMFVAIAILYNFTEAAFNKMGLIWFALLVVAIEYPHPRTGAIAGDEIDDSDGGESDEGVGVEVGERGWLSDVRWMPMVGWRN